MRIDNLEINSNMTTILDTFITELKRNGSNLFSKGHKLVNGYHIVQCPYHKMGQERHPSAQFRDSDGLFYCFNCKKSHRFTEVVYDFLNVNGRSWLLSNFDGSDIEDRKVSFNLGKKEEVKTPTFIDKSILDQYKGTHPYMYKRKLTDEVIKKFDIGYDKNFVIDIKNSNGQITGHKVVGECVTFPNKDENGNIVFIARRAINQKFFHYPTGVDKPVYGLYEIYQEIKAGKEITEIYVCESMFNCLTLWAWGKYAVALNGTGSTTQINILKKTPFRSFILALDPDFAGQKGTERIKKELKASRKIVKTLPIPTGKDVNDLEYEEFEKLTPSGWI